MTRHTQPPAPTSRNTTTPHEHYQPRPQWWEVILRWLGHRPSPRLENRWPTSTARPEAHPESQHAPEPELWTPEESRVLQRYHARNLTAARRATEQLVREGWHTGPVPYGYRPQRVWISAAGQPRRYRTRLVIEPVEASVVNMIFLWRVQEVLEVEEIVERLNGARYPAPLRAGATEPCGWARATVVSILANPKYTGYQVWGRTHHGSPMPSEHWVWSGPWAHSPVIDTETFLAAQQLSSRSRRLPVQDEPNARAA